MPFQLLFQANSKYGTPALKLMVPSGKNGLTTKFPGCGFFGDGMGYYGW
jgi:hypothetical protein